MLSAFNGLWKSPKWAALPNPVFRGPSHGVPWWVAFQETASPFYITVSKHSQKMFTSLLILRCCLIHSEHCHWYVLKTQQLLCGQWPQSAQRPQLRLSWMFLWVLVWHPQTTPSQKAEQSATTCDLSCRSCGLDAACILFYGSNILVSDELACGGEGLYSSVSLRLGSYSLLHRVYQLHKHHPPAMHTLCKPDCYHSESKSSGRTSLRQSIISWINGLLKCLAQLSWRAMEDSRSWPTQTQGREDMPFWQMMRTASCPLSKVWKIIKSYPERWVDPLKWQNLKPQGPTQGGPWCQNYLALIR